MENTRKTRITHRIVNSKRHTLGYVLVGGQRVSRAKAVQMASRSLISGVSVVNGPSGRYVQSTGERGLYQLPVMREDAAKQTRRPSRTKVKATRTKTEAKCLSQDSSRS